MTQATLKENTLSHEKLQHDPLGWLAEFMSQVKQPPRPQTVFLKMPDIPREVRHFDFLLVDDSDPSLGRNNITRDLACE